jgi:hypothetical protein
MTLWLLLVGTFASLAMSSELGMNVPVGPSLVCAWNRTETSTRTVEPRADDSDVCRIDIEISAPCTPVSFRNLSAVSGACELAIRSPAQCFSLQIQSDFAADLSVDSSGAIQIVFHLDVAGSRLGSLSDVIFVDNLDGADLTARFQSRGPISTSSFESLFSLNAVPCSLVPDGKLTQPTSTRTVTETTTAWIDTATTLVPQTCTPVTIELSWIPGLQKPCRVQLPSNTELPCFSVAWNDVQDVDQTCAISYRSPTSGTCLRADLFARFDPSTPGLFGNRFGELAAVVTDTAPLTHRVVNVVGTSIAFNIYARVPAMIGSVGFYASFTTYDCAGVVPATTTWAGEPDDTTTIAGVYTSTRHGPATTTTRPTRHTRKTQPLTDRPDADDDETGSNTGRDDARRDDSWIWITATAVSVSLVVIGVVIAIVCVVVRRRRAAMVPSFLIRPPPGAPPPTRFVIV